jgi:osmotically-inducible protein OsmY
MRERVIQAILLAGVMAFALAAQDAAPARANAAGMTDSQLSSGIRQAIMNDAATEPFARQIHVTAKNGEVTLTGEVNSALERGAIAAHARQIAGISHVKDKITVKK